MCSIRAVLLQRCLQFYRVDVQMVFWVVLKAEMEHREGCRTWGGRFAELVRSLALRSAKGASASLPKHRSRAVRGQSLRAFRRKDGADRAERCVTNCLQLSPIPVREPTPYRACRPPAGKAAGGSLVGEAPGRATTTAWPPFFCASVSSLSSGAGRPLPMRKDSLTCLKPVSQLNLCPLATSNKRTCPLLPVEDRGDGSPTRQT